MERTVIFLCGCWLWLTRKRRSLRYRQIASSLHSASVYLLSDFAGRASTRDRGFLLPDQEEALGILQKQSTKAFHTSRRLSSLVECYRFAAEELGPVISPPPTLLTPIADYRDAGYRKAA
jgi:hypothetical protein